MLPNLQYEARGLPLAPGDSVLFYTDGLVEAFSPEGAMFGFERLMELFGRIGDRPADEVVSGLLEAVCEWQGDDNRHDDMTAIILQIR